MTITPEHRKGLPAFISEREAIRRRKNIVETCSSLQGRYLVQNKGVPQDRKEEHLDSLAWGGGRYTDYWTADRLTDDPFLRQYRFCNVRRADDRVTRWIVEHISETFADHEHLWFMLAIARTFNWPPTLELLLNRYEKAWPGNAQFEPRQMTALIESCQKMGWLPKVHTGAYMIRAESVKTTPWYSWSKVRYMCEVVLGKLWEDRDACQGVVDGGTEHQPTLKECWDWVQQYRGWGPFMTYQWVVDLRWTRYLRDAPDINTWAALGPGSRRGLNRLHGRRVDAPLTQEQGLEEMLAVRGLVNQPGVLAPWVEVPIDLSDIQNCLCEYDKYCRVKNGEGRPRALYVPGRGA